MLKSLWVLTRTVALSVTVGAGIAAAQTVVVRDAPPGATIEVQVNGGAAHTAAADRLGDATITVASPSNSPEVDVRMVIERCDARVRVHILGAGFTAETPANCTRTDVPWLFVMRPVTSFVVDLAGQGPTVHLRQGPVPPEWLLRGAAAVAAQGGPRIDAPSGFMLSGGVGLANFANALDVACGNVSSCSGGTTKTALGGSATYWFKPFLGARVGFLKPVKHAVEGAGSGYTFDSTLDTRFITAAGAVGVPIGRARIYGMGGMHFHNATFIQNETIETTTITIDNVPTTFEGGSQTLSLETDGWGWQFGGGLEWWWTPRVSLFGEGEFIRLRGNDNTGGDARIEENLLVVSGGVRVRLGQ